MAEMDEFTPKDWADIKIEPGKYGFVVEVKRCTFRDTEKEKPFMNISFIVLEGDKTGFEFDDRVYISKKAEIEGLRGKVLVEVSVDNFGMLKAEVKKFDHLGGDEIEKELGKQVGSQEELPLSPATDAEPTREIDLNADLSAEDTTTVAGQAEVQEPPEPDLSSLDD